MKFKNIIQRRTSSRSRGKAVSAPTETSVKDGTPSSPSGNPSTLEQEQTPGPGDSTNLISPKRSSDRVSKRKNRPSNLKGRSFGKGTKKTVTWDDAGTARGVYLYTPPPSDQALLAQELKVRPGEEPSMTNTKIYVVAAAEVINKMDAIVTKMSALARILGDACEETEIFCFKVAAQLRSQLLVLALPPERAERASRIARWLPVHDAEQSRFLFAMTERMMVEGEKTRLALREKWSPRYVAPPALDRRRKEVAKFSLLLHRLTALQNELALALEGMRASRGDPDASPNESNAWWRKYKAYNVPFLCDIPLALWSDLGSVIVSTEAESPVSPLDFALEMFKSPYPNKLPKAKKYQEALKWNGVDVSGLNAYTEPDRIFESYDEAAKKAGRRLMVKTLKARQAERGEAIQRPGL